MKNFISIFITGVLLLSCTSVPKTDLVITGATLIDGTGGQTRPESTIFIHDGHISKVVSGSEVKLPNDAEIIDAAGKYVIPGLADMHLHFSLGLPRPRLSNETEVVLSRLLYYGVTSILAIGASGASTDSIRILRDRRTSGKLKSPYIYGTGGHLTLHGTHPIYTIFPPSVQNAADSLASEIPMNEPVNLYSLGIGLSIVRTEEAVRKAVRERAEGDMDAIKITVESGPTMRGDNHPQMSVKMIRTIVDEASKYNLGVFAHITSIDELKAVLEGGASGIVHTVWDQPLPDSTLADHMAGRDFYVIPTTSLYRGAVSLYYIDEPVNLDDPFLRETISDKEVESLRDTGFIEHFRSRGLLSLGTETDPSEANRIQVSDMLKNVGMLHKQNVPIVLGTDTGTPFTFPGYSVHDELEHLVKAGFSPGEALEAATRRAAEMLDAEDEFGTIEPGKRADLLILSANPLENIRNTRSLQIVISEGQVINREALLGNNK